MFYQYAAIIEGKEHTEDDLAYFRDEREFTNLVINELPNFDFAFSIVRQYLLDVHACLYLEKMQNSTDVRLKEISAKAIKESRYHLKRSETWVLQLGQGTAESAKRMQAALDELWGYTPELFIASEAELELANSGNDGFIAADREALRDVWLEQVTAHMLESGLRIPEQNWQVVGGRKGDHSEHLGHLLSEMQILQRSYPGLEW